MVKRKYILYLISVSCLVFAACGPVPFYRTGSVSVDLLYTEKEESSRAAAARAARATDTEPNPYYAEFLTAWDGIGTLKSSYTPTQFKVPYESVTLYKYTEWDEARVAGEVVTPFNQGLLPLDILTDVEAHYADFTEPLITEGNAMQAADYDFLDMRLYNTNTLYIHFEEIDGEDYVIPAPIIIEVELPGYGGVFVNEPYAEDELALLKVDHLYSASWEDNVTYGDARREKYYDKANSYFEEEDLYHRRNVKGDVFRFDLAGLTSNLNADVPFLFNSRPSDSEYDSVNSVNMSTMDAFFFTTIDNVQPTASAPEGSDYFYSIPYDVYISEGYEMNDFVESAFQETCSFKEIAIPAIGSFNLEDGAGATVVVELDLEGLIQIYEPVGGDPDDDSDDIVVLAPDYFERWNAYLIND